jgi:glucose uptake protein GlcU
MKMLCRLLSALATGVNNPSLFAKLPTSRKITLPLIFLASLFFLICALTPGQSFRNREQRLTVLTALFGLLYVGLELYWYFSVGFLQFRGVAAVHYFAWHLLGGVFLAMLVNIVSPKSTEVVLLISGLSFVAFNLFVILHYNPRHLASAFRFSSLGNGLFIGMSITSAIFFWLDNRKGSNHNGNGDAAMPGTTRGNGREA